uniref:DUF4354 family protein n=1 Tax=Hafnia alvei TaxID=569 RepID=UPI003C6D4B67
MFSAGLLPPDLNFLKLDTVDEILISSSLSRHKHVNGIALLSSDSNVLYSTHLIKISSNYK